MSAAAIERELARHRASLTAFDARRVARLVTAEIMSELGSDRVTGYSPTGLTPHMTAIELSRVEHERREAAEVEARERVLALYRRGRVDAALVEALDRWHRAERALAECRRARRECEVFELVEGGAP